MIYILNSQLFVIFTTDNFVMCPKAGKINNFWLNVGL